MTYLWRYGPPLLGPASGSFYGGAASRWGTSGDGVGRGRCGGEGERGEDGEVAMVG